MMALGLLLFSACSNDPVVEQPVGTPYKLEENSKVIWKGRAGDGHVNEGTIDVKGVAQGYDFDILNNEIRGGVFTFPVSSITVTNLPTDPVNLKAQLEGHLKTADFFYLVAHPNVTFKIKSGKPATFSGSNNNYQIKGEMTLLGSTHPLEFPAHVAIANGTLTIKAAFTFNQTTWGMNYHIDPSYPDKDRIVAGVDVNFELVAKAK